MEAKGNIQKWNEDMKQGDWTQVWGKLTPPRTSVERRQQLQHNWRIKNNDSKALRPLSPSSAKFCETVGPMLGYQRQTYFIVSAKMFASI